jgi:hypothetical protein
MTEILAGLRDDPVTAAIGCAAIVPVVVWTISVVHWMIMGEMDFLFGVTAILCSMLLGMVALWPAEPIYAPMALAGLVALMVVFPIVRRQLDRRALVMIDVEQIEGAYAMLAEKPDNASAMFRLAERLYERGLVGHAIGIGEKALQNMPQSLFPQENRAIQLWKRAAAGPHRPLPCLECGRHNGTDSTHCEGCGAPYLAAYARGKWLGPKLAMRLVAAWVAAMVALVGIPVVATSIADPVMAFALVALQTALAAGLLWKAFVYKGDTP